MEFECPHTHLVSTVYISSIMAVQFSEFNVFVQHETLGLRKFESLLREDRYISVPEAFRLTFGVLASPTLQAATEPDAPQLLLLPHKLIRSIGLDTIVQLHHTHSNHKKSIE